jgi:GT2 family glycosyltransferase
MTCFGMITTRNSAFYTGPALESFFRCTEFGPDDRFVLIDNDGDYVLPDGFPRVELVRPAAPRGFAANVNDILRRALEMRTDAAVLNNDIVFTPGWWLPLTERQDAVVLPMCNQQVQYTIGDRVVFRAALDWDDYAGNETALLAAADYHRVHTPPGTYRDELRVSLYCFRVPLPVLDRIGLFDESFGRGGGEDSDYILRARLAGYGVVWGGGSFVLHFAGKSTWRSGEQRAETGGREERYVARFQAKWGRDLAALFLFGEAPEAAIGRLGLAEAYTARDYRRMVADCLARRAAD